MPSRFTFHNGAWLPLPVKTKTKSWLLLLILVTIANNSWPVICPIRPATILGKETKTLSDKATSTCVSFVALLSQDGPAAADPCVFRCHAVVPGVSFGRTVNFCDFRLQLFDYQMGTLAEFPSRAVATE
jgi:hypothetical protein